MQAGNVYRYRIASADLAFGLAAGGGAQAVELALPEAIAAGRHCRCRVREIRLWSTVAIKYGLQFYAKAGKMGGPTIDLETYLGEWAFGNSAQPGDGTRATGDTFFYYYINGLDIAYQNADAASPSAGVVAGNKLLMRVVNWDAAVPKAAAANLVIELGLEPLQGM